MAQMTANGRLAALQRFAANRLLTNPNKCTVLVDIVKKSGQLVGQQSHPVNAMMDDLLKVMVGEGLRSRGTGTYFFMNHNSIIVPFPTARGSEGFKPELQDRSVQISHAVAGIYIGYHYNSLVEAYVRWQDPEEHDKLLYDATFALGNALTDDNFGSLWERLAGAICAGNATNTVTKD